MLAPRLLLSNINSLASRLACSVISASVILFVVSFFTQASTKELFSLGARSESAATSELVNNRPTSYSVTQLFWYVALTTVTGNNASGSRYSRPNHQIPLRTRLLSSTRYRLRQITRRVLRFDGYPVSDVQH